MSLVEKKSKTRAEYWSLFEVRDRFGTWRGCALRTTANKLTLRRSALDGQNDVNVRVLVTSGIATGVGTWSGPCGHQPSQSGPDRPHIVLLGDRTNQSRVELTTLHAFVIGVRSRDTGHIRWYDSNGAELVPSFTPRGLGSSPGSQPS